MRALVYAGPGRIEVADVPVPVPGPAEVLVEVDYLGVCGTDLLLARGGFGDRVTPGVVIGHEFCGRIAGTGTPVAVEPLISCGHCAPCRAGHRHVCRNLGLYGIDRDGGGAEFVVVAETAVHPLPAGLAPVDAALTEPAAVAVHMVRRAGVTVGDTVLILGGGPIGALVGVVALAAGAARVVVSEPRADRRALLATAGLQTLDPTAADLPAWCATAEPDGFDVTFEVSGAAAAIAAVPAVTAVRGTVLLGALSDRPSTVGLATVMLKEQHLVGSRVYTSADVRRAVALLASGAVPAGLLVTDVLTLEQAATSAFVPGGLMKTLITP